MDNIMPTIQAKDDLMSKDDYRVLLSLMYYQILIYNLSSKNGQTTLSWILIPINGYQFV